jgi:hypothetical protein
MYKICRGFLPVKACAAVHALIYASTLKLQLDVGLATAKFKALILSTLVSPIPIPYTFGFIWFRITSACALYNLVM